jgi:hypothetical protein
LIGLLVEEKADIEKVDVSKYVEATTTSTSQSAKQT